MLHWNGSSWRVVATPDPTHNFVGWVAAGAGQAWAVGRNDRGALTMRWKNGRWVVVQSPRPAGSSLSDVTISSATDVWATGTARSGPFVMHWNGTTWSIVERAGFGQGKYASVALIPGTTEVWIYGDDEASYGLAAARSSVTGWEKFLLPVKGAGWSTTSRSLVADTATSAWIAITVNNDAGVSHPVTLNWNGTTWNPVRTPNPGGNASLTGIAAATASDIWTVGSYVTKRPKARTKRSFVLHWDGSKWSNVGGFSHAGRVRPGVAVGLAGVAATPDTGPVWAFGTTLDEYSC